MPSFQKREATPRLDPETGNRVQPWIELLDGADIKRTSMRFPPDSAFRLFDGEGDGHPGVFIDVFAGRWLVQTLAPALPDGLAAALKARGVPWWWKRLDQAEKNSPQPMSEAVTDDPFVIVENGLNFEISFSSGYSQGLFIDQRENRLRVREKTKPGQRVLNLFAYTGGFSVAAAAAGATTTTVDLSGSYLEWAKRNFVLNDLDPAKHFFTKGDAMDWLGAFFKKQRTFDGLVIDPPTFSRTKEHGVWRAESDYHRLVEAAARLVAPDGWMFCSTNCRTMDHDQFEAQVRKGLAAAGRKMRIERGKMPGDFTGEAYLLNVWCS